ncbi:MAG: peptidoglycan recognition protein family protein [Ignavibacteria bacterium]
MREDKIIIHPRTVWGAIDPKPYKFHHPVRITIHHEGTYFLQDSLAFRHIKNIQIWGMRERKWADVPYHFFIDGFGNIIEGRNIFTAGETNTSYNPEGHILISVIGEYHRKQKLNSSQYNSLLNLIAHLCIKFNISPDSIRGHRDYCKPGETNCPGDNIYQLLENGKIINDVKKIIE